MLARIRENILIYQFFAEDDKIINEGIHWHFVGIALLNALWLALWDDDLLFLSLIVILIIACQVTHIYHQLYYVHRYDKRLSWKYAFIHLPFTLYHAWIVVVAILTTFATITPEKTYSTTDRSSTETANSPNIIVQLVVILGLLFLESTAVAYIEAREDYAGGAINMIYQYYHY
ncbi:hypothetical protein F8M41_002788 [Gigaspora margarita]|uniref:Uncharacterized protein n=1 Tax=Gigaspora margarita TaxID=4874 RepID=A0A8H3XC99_GIGMA|nr:hypothetical protein F8M41_002788 [Gigaspora margarita]